MQCAKLAYQSGIKEFIYKHEYRNDEGINFLKSAGVNIWKIP
jgi:dCMP deaminase